ncbi:tRNA (adenosine(37)-N6)-threonylcarbamoyltransferase complex dimerization subunit type 1 TsaB [Arcticibacterium luteifluviistationis]|uniref:tRNA (Adenosine(37)-N6)-threonylcarbamoyltransferase complex dimerization subunit type 1 TsaB n=1 Tax=Arcticibacterium luteifluviistationis TaxID=1784714 RepID=A0A2Z4GD91_9BACT|nr:tRNA (adenosine(37)-N6)-threonylcarbamoyltransferase complex dimerization subunit type 1 TsaB [Arcticibacterium luteifluviistationis]AWV99111.1 tRNA (adenosine(37)-N6)-threonylcarbamoyltransferase complex dimerization subunit type 1 TsaB [Arcticibacterium luteifluviistationis]
MALILSVETSVNGCSVAIHEDGIVRSNFELFEERSSAEMLTVLMEQALRVSKKDFSDLDALAVSKGPGSYTGLRIGVSTVKGVCYAMDLPLVSMNSLDIMIAQIKPTFNGLICPMLDARRMEVYCKVVNAKKEELMPTTAVVVDEDSFEGFLKDNKVLFCGEGAEKVKTIITHPNAAFLGSEIRPKACDMGQAAFLRFENGEFENVSDFEPFYLKEFVGTTPSKNKKVTA